MVTPEKLHDLVAADAEHPDRNPEARRRALRDALSTTGPASDADVVGAALAGLRSDDRNVRVAMLRVLALYGDETATDGVLRGLADPARRVREGAIKSSSPLHLQSDRVLESLRRIAEDESEIGRIRGQAFFVLSSRSARDAVPDVAREAIRTLMDSERFRLPILVRLCKSFDQTPDSRALLQEFVRTGTKEEAVMATRALCGQCLVRVDAWMPAERRRFVREQFDPGPTIRGSKIGDGPVNYWMPAAAALQLLEEVGLTRIP